jgi:hypothetical protein
VAATAPRLCVPRTRRSGRTGTERASARARWLQREMGLDLGTRKPYLPEERFRGTTYEGFESAAKVCPHLHRDWAHPCPCHICTGTGPTPPRSAPGLGPPWPHLHRDWAHPPPTSAPGLGPPPATHMLACACISNTCALACVHAHAHARAQMRMEGMVYMVPERPTWAVVKEKNGLCPSIVQPAVCTAIACVRVHGRVRVSAHVHVSARILRRSPHRRLSGCSATM